MKLKPVIATCGYCLKPKEGCRKVYLRTGLSSWENKAKWLCCSCQAYLWGNWRRADEKDSDLPKP